VSKRFSYLGLLGLLLLSLSITLVACGKDPAQDAAPGTLNFDSASFCDNHPKAHGCCREENLTRINFDDAANKTLAPLGIRYDKLGISFSSGTSGPYLVSKAFEGHGSVSGENALLFGLNRGSLSFTFFDPETRTNATTNIVSAFVGDYSDETDMIIMTGYAFNGHVVAVDTFVSQPSGSLGNNDFGEIKIEGEAMARIVVRDTSASGADLDDLAFGCLHFKLR